MFYVLGVGLGYLFGYTLWVGCCHVDDELANSDDLKLKFHHLLMSVEQLRTHTRKLNHLHPPENHGGKQMVQLFEKGYGKDPAGIAMEAINHARQVQYGLI